MSERAFVDEYVPSALGSANMQLTSESWRNMGRALAGRRSRLEGGASRHMWEVGDWLLAGEDRVFNNLNRSKVRELAAEVSGYSRHTLRMAVSVARKVDPSVRVDGLSWWHHLYVADRTTDEQRHWLTRAAEEGWSIAALRSKLRAAENVDARVVDARRTARRTARVVRDLLDLRREDVPDELMSQLRRWLDAPVRS